MDKICKELEIKVFLSTFLKFSEIKIIPFSQKTVQIKTFFILLLLK